MNSELSLISLQQVETTLGSGEQADKTLCTVQRGWSCHRLLTKTISHHVTGITYV